MKDFYHRYALPFIIMVVSSLLVRLIRTYIRGAFSTELVAIVIALCLFCFGLSLNIKKRSRYESWLKKVLLSFILLFFVCWDLGYVVFPAIKSVFDFFGINGFVVYMVYIYCGWAFFD